MKHHFIVSTFFAVAMFGVGCAKLPQVQAAKDSLQSDGVVPGKQAHVELPGLGVSLGMSVEEVRTSLGDIPSTYEPEKLLEQNGTLFLRQEGIRCQATLGSQ